MENWSKCLLEESFGRSKNYEPMKWEARFEGAPLDFRVHYINCSYRLSLHLKYCQRELLPFLTFFFFNNRNDTERSHLVQFKKYVLHTLRVLTSNNERESFHFQEAFHWNEELTTKLKIPVSIRQSDSCFQTRKVSAQ